MPTSAARAPPGSMAVIVFPTKQSHSSGAHGDGLLRNREDVAQVNATVIEGASADERQEDQVHTGVDPPMKTRCQGGRPIPARVDARVEDPWPRVGSPASSP